MDYVGYITDSCHDKTEAKLQVLCARGKAEPIKGAMVAQNKERDVASARADKDSTALALAPETASAADAPVGKADLNLIRSGLERAFSRRLPDSAL